jgi:hypothetical protein
MSAAYAQLRAAAEDCMPLKFSVQVDSTLLRTDTQRRALEEALKEGLIHCWSHMTGSSDVPLLHGTPAAAPVVAANRGFDTVTLHVLMPEAAARQLTAALIANHGGVYISIPGAASLVLAHLHDTHGNPYYLFTLASSLATYPPEALVKYMGVEKGRFPGLQLVWLGRADARCGHVSSRVGVEGVALPFCQCPHSPLSPLSIVGLAVGGQDCLHSPVVVSCPGQPVEFFVLRRIPNRVFSSMGQPVASQPPPGPGAPVWAPGSAPFNPTPNPNCYPNPIPAGSVQPGQQHPAQQQHVRHPVALQQPHPPPPSVQKPVLQPGKPPPPPNTAGGEGPPDAVMADRVVRRAASSQGATLPSIAACHHPILTQAYAVGRGASEAGATTSRCPRKGVVSPSIHQGTARLQSPAAATGASMQKPRGPWVQGSGGIRTLKAAGTAQPGAGLSGQVRREKSRPYPPSTAQGEKWQCKEAPGHAPTTHPHHPPSVASSGGYGNGRQSEEGDDYDQGTYQSLEHTGLHTTKAKGSQSRRLRQ